MQGAKNLVAFAAPVLTEGWHLRQTVYLSRAKLFVQSRLQTFGQHHIDLGVHHLI